MSPVVQEKWLNDLDFFDSDGERVVDVILRKRYRSRYMQFEKMPFANEITGVLREYITKCIPAIKRSEISFWMCSCLPNSSKNLYSRINVGWQTTFEVLVDADKPCFVWHISRSLLEQALDLSFSDLEPGYEIPLWFENRPDCKALVGNSSLVKGGQNQVYIFAEGVDTAMTLIHDDGILLASRIFNLGLMQKGPCPWGMNHCLDLADKLIE
jgi:hypothetical protein